jgi:hypothetical protein
MPDADGGLGTEFGKQVVFDLLPDVGIPEHFRGMHGDFSHDPLQEFLILFHAKGQLVHVHLKLQQDPRQTAAKGSMGIIRKVVVGVLSHGKLKVLNILANYLHWVNLTI